MPASHWEVAIGFHRQHKDQGLYSCTSMYSWNPGLSYPLWLSYPFPDPLSCTQGGRSSFLYQVKRKKSLTDPRSDIVVQALLVLHYPGNITATLAAFEENMGGPPLPDMLHAQPLGCVSWFGISTAGCQTLSGSDMGTAGMDGSFSRHLGPSRSIKILVNLNRKWTVSINQGITVLF